LSRPILSWTSWGLSGVVISAVCRPTMILTYTLLFVKLFWLK
jgi:hypothetical protein